MKDPPVPILSPPEPGWRNSAVPIIHGDVQVIIMESAVGQVPLVSSNGEKQLSKRLLAVRIQIRNLGRSKKMEYTSWNGNAVLSDESGNHYKRIDFGTGIRAIGAVDVVKLVYPGMAITDLLVFERPITSAQTLKLELPTENVGGEGMIRILIPRQSVIE